ncbi:MAG: WG repeat-containing protein [Bacteroidales bacterium]|nr:WG repeat-containing protein [Candidatus Colimorpha onthohippi]
MMLDHSSKRYGFVKDDGTWLIKPIYQRATAFRGEERKYAVVRYDDFWGCIDIQGNMVVRNVFGTREEAEDAGAEWMKADEPGRWVYPACNAETRKWGFVNYYGQWKFQPIYEGAGTFTGREPMSFAAVKINERWGCIDSKGILIVNSVFETREQAELAGNQWISGRHYDTWRMGVLDAKTGKYGVVNYLGRWVVKPDYEMICNFGDDHHHAYAQAKREGRWGNIDRNGKHVAECIFATAADAAYALNEMEHGRKITSWRFPVEHPETHAWGWVDYLGEWVISPMYQEVTHFVGDTGHFATAKLDKRWCVVGETGMQMSKVVFVIPTDAWQAGVEWDGRKELGYWQCPVMDTTTHSWGYVNYKGDWSIRATFDDAKGFEGEGANRFAPAKREGLWGCIDNTGKFVVNHQYKTSAEAYEQGRKWSARQKY